MLQLRVKHHLVFRLSKLDCETIQILDQSLFPMHFQPTPVAVYMSAKAYTEPFETSSSRPHSILHRPSSIHAFPYHDGGF